jgi:hypothetical protein
MEYTYRISTLLLEIDFLREKQKYYNGTSVHHRLVHHTIDQIVLKMENLIIRLGEKTDINSPS